MRLPKSLAFSLLLLCCVLAAGKGKKKVLLPEDVLQARTVLVVVDPEAGMAIDDPNVNNTARNDVENAILKWGRFRLGTDGSSADLVIMVRKGNGKIVEPTIGGVPNNNEPVMVQHGGPRNPSMAGDPTAAQPTNPGRPQVEAGQTEDMMAVYRGKRDDALDSPAVWRYSAKDALESPSVPAVDRFRKLIAEAEKQQANTP